MPPTSSPRLLTALFCLTSVWALATDTLAQTPATTGAPTRSTSPGPATLVDLDALIRVESRSMGADGVARSSVYEENFMRRGPQVWTRRIIPRQAPVHAHDKDEKAGHKHLDPFEGGRLITLVDGKPQMSLILPHEKTVVAIPSVDFGNLGFDGSWERAYHLVTQRELSALQPTTRKSDIPGTQWYEKKGETTESVLWDRQRMVARVIESSNRQGNQWRRVTLLPQSDLGKTVPWDAQRIQTYEQLRYSDFLD